MAVECRAHPSQTRVLILDRWPLHLLEVHACSAPHGAHMKHRSMRGSCILAVAVRLCANFLVYTSTPGPVQFFWGLQRHEVDGMVTLSFSLSLSGGGEGAGG